MTQAFNFQSIGMVHACYQEKFGVPRQPGLVKVVSSIEIFPPYNNVEAFRALETFSHIWIVFVFHQTQHQGWHPTVRPPRLGGNERVGVFASRSMFRPNPVGLSVVELKAIRQQGSQLFLDVIGADLIQGTPVLDIKPYLPYAEALPQARSGYAIETPAATLQVKFFRQAMQVLQQQINVHPDLQHTIIEILQLDPRPAYADGQVTQKDYAMRLYEFDVHWRVTGDVVEVFDIVEAKTKGLG